MYCWGSTENGELGLGGVAVEQVFQPMLNEFGHSWNLKSISAGLTHTLFLTEEGQVYSCGNGEFGQLGHNKPTRRPEHVDTLENYNIIKISAGDQHSLALTSWGEIYSWGENGFGQLGLNSSQHHFSYPCLVKSLAKKQVIQISCGANHSLALTSDNEVYAWGQNTNGELGLGHQRSPINEPHCVKTLSAIPLRCIEAGGHHSIALSKAGFLITWGANKHGQLGRPNNEQTVNCCCSPNLVPNLAAYSEPIKYVAAGENHTAVLDANGKLWTFGSGRYGQLGQGKFTDNPIPQPVLDLVGTKVDQVACGRCHTLVYISSQGQIYSFGLGMSGQLGLKAPQNRGVPQAVVGPWSAPSGRSVLNMDSRDHNQENIFYVNKVFAGGDASFVCISITSKYGQDFAKDCPSLQPNVIDEEKINLILGMGEDDMIDDDLFTYCETTMGALGCWNGSFVSLQSVSRTDHSLSYFRVKEFMKKLSRIKRESLYEMIKVGFENMLRNFPSTYLTPEALRMFVMFPMWREFDDAKNASILHIPFANSILSLDIISSLTYRRWLSYLPKEYLQNLISQYKKVVIFTLRSIQDNSHGSTAQKEDIILTSVKLLDFIYKENKIILNEKYRIALEDFYIAEIPDYIDLRKDYMDWVSGGASRVGGNWTRSLCFCEYSFLFDARAKTLLLRFDAARQMQGAITDAVHQTNPLMWFFNPNEIQFVNLSVRRDNLVCDTLSQIDAQPYSSLKKPLRVHFVGEEAEDAGGVRKEFFLLLLKELLNPDYGMFAESQESRTIWFRHGALEADAMYSLIGIVCGLAIYNVTIINLPFPLALYKKLLDEPVQLEDFAEMEPTVAKGLRDLLEYPGDDVQDVFCLTFSATNDHFGESRTVPLKPGGEDIPVTSQNKKEYVDLIVDWKLNQSVETQYRCFHKGFHRVCGGGILQLFQPSELMQLVTGNENYDWDVFQKSTVYKGEYSADHPTIKLFWEVFQELTIEQKKKFLLFLTGCDRIPILGMETLKMTIESTKDANYLPVAHTCVAQLDLPIYLTKEKLRYKLLQAIQQSKGFGLV